MKFTKTTLKRAAKTFIQSAVSYLVVSLAAVDFSTDSTALRTVLLGLCVSAVSSGLAAVMNLEKKRDQNDVQ